MQPIRKASWRLWGHRAVSARFCRGLEHRAGRGLRRAPQARAKLRRENDGQTDDTKPEMRTLGHDCCSTIVAGAKFSDDIVELKHSVCRALDAPFAPVMAVISGLA
jgi:hypothetical protein